MGAETVGWSDGTGYGGLGGGGGGEWEGRGLGGGQCRAGAGGENMARGVTWSEVTPKRWGGRPTITRVYVRLAQKTRTRSHLKQKKEREPERGGGTISNQPVQGGALPG